MALLGELRILLPLEGLVDVEAESARLSKEIEKHAKDLAKCEGKLSNQNFIARAPEEVVAKERTRVEDLRSAIHRLNEQLERLSALSG